MLKVAQTPVYLRMYQIVRDKAVLGHFAKLFFLILITDCSAMNRSN